MAQVGEVAARRQSTASSAERDENVEAQRADEVKAERKAYAAITSKPVHLDVETACGICNESSGAHRRARRRD